MTDKNDFDFEDELTPEKKNEEKGGETESFEGLTESVEGDFTSSGTGFRETATSGDTEEVANFDDFATEQVSSADFENEGSLSFEDSFSNPENAGSEVCGTQEIAMDFDPASDFEESKTQQMDFAVESSNENSKLQKGVGFDEFSSQSGDDVDLTEEMGIPGEVGLTEEIGLSEDAVLTDSFESSEYRTELVDQDDDEEVLVLLPDDEPQEISADSVDDVATESYDSPVEGASLRTTNPHHEDAEIEDEHEEDGFELQDAENVGVIDEIAALATSLDQDILNSDELQDSLEGDEVYQPEFEAPAAHSGSGSRTKIFVGLAAVAAIALTGVFFYPKLAEKYFPDSSQGENGGKIALANGAKNNTKDPSQNSGDSSNTKVEVVENTPDVDGSQEGLVAQAFEEKLVFVLNLGLDR